MCWGTNTYGYTREFIRREWMYDEIERRMEGVLRGMVTEMDGIIVVRSVRFSKMSLTPPKRLFNIRTMRTMLYDHVADDVKRKGYVTISHVWGDQRMYTADELGISGVNWEVPLSDSHKICRIKKFMNKYDKEYCWFDVLCMPQNKQDEINKEIPFMGDYYSGAEMTLVLATVRFEVSDDFMKWYHTMVDVIQSRRSFTSKERVWMSSKRNLLDISGDKWFSRVWTLQEAVLSKTAFYIGLDGNYIHLTSVARAVMRMFERDRTLLTVLFGKCSFMLYSVASAEINHEGGCRDLAVVLAQSSMRDCYKPQDRFYGALGILGYKDFVVNYNVDMDELNKRMAQYAYSKGDISWMTVGGNIGTGFIQPMYREMSGVGGSWKEDSSNACGVIFGKTLNMSAMKLATVSRSKKLAETQEMGNLFRWSVHAFRDWGFNDDVITRAMTEFCDMSRIEFEMTKVLLDCHTRDANVPSVMRPLFGEDNMTKYYGDVMYRTHQAICNKRTVIAATVSGTEVPLLVDGDADIGDSIVLVRAHDKHDRILGIVTSGSRRKGVCLYSKAEISRGDVLASYEQHRFSL